VLFPSFSGRSQPDEIAVDAQQRPWRLLAPPAIVDRRVARDEASLRRVVDPRPGQGAPSSAAFAAAHGKYAGNRCVVAFVHRVISWALGKGDRRCWPWFDDMVPELASLVHP